MSPARARLATRRRAPPLEAKKRPEQQRAAETVERILEATAAALADIGFERLSTNIVCARAGLTPPALYRYFPNKYALLYELGRRLMQRARGYRATIVSGTSIIRDDAPTGALPGRLVRGAQEPRRVA